MHKNYNSCLHILDMHVERGRPQFSHRKQILVFFQPEVVKKRRPVYGYLLFSREMRKVLSKEEPELGEPRR